MGEMSMFRHDSRSWPCGLACALCGLLAGSGALAQDAAYFSPTYAASDGSPYSSVYARAFGAGGPPLETGASLPAPPPAPPKGPAAAAPGVVPSVVYVIEGGRLLTYRAEDYASGGGAALAHSSVPAADAAYVGLRPEVRVPTVADGFYALPTVETAAGPEAAGKPVPLLPGQ